MGTVKAEDFDQTVRAALRHYAASRSQRILG
jgi:hypothetical protein